MELVACVAEFVGDVGEECAPRLQPFDHRQRLRQGKMGGMGLGAKGIEDQDVQALEQGNADSGISLTSVM